MGLSETMATVCFLCITLSLASILLDCKTFRASLGDLLTPAHCEAGRWMPHWLSSGSPVSVPKQAQTFRGYMWSPSTTTTSLLYKGTNFPLP